MKRRFNLYLWLILLAVVLTVGCVSGPSAQTLDKRRPLPSQSVVDLRRRLIELDRLLLLRSLSRAESLLQTLEQHSALTRELVSRRIRLTQLKGEHAEAVTLCQQALQEQSQNPALWRSLADSHLALQQGPEARTALTRYLETSADARSSGVVAVEMLQAAGFNESAVSLIDSLRISTGNNRAMGRQRALGLLTIGRQADAADEVSSELRFNPFNISFLRTELLEGVYLPSMHETFLDRLAEKAAEPGAKSAEALLLADLYLFGADTEAALETVEPLLKDRASALAVLQNAVMLSRELYLFDAKPILQSTVDYLLAVLEELSGPDRLDNSLRRRSADFLAGVCEDALALGLLGDDPDQAVSRFAELLTMVRQVNPGSERLYSSQIKLAAYTRDVLGNPKAAARRLERMLMDLDLPSEGVALARLTLGQCYLAAGDTARGRQVLTGLGRDQEFRQAAGHAHYDLARLDLAEGHFATARDRFAIVALDNPAAPYANDALEMGLAVSEEMDNPSGGPDVLQHYARSVYFNLVAQPDSQIIALQGFISQALIRLDLEEPQHLLERARYDLGQLLTNAGRFDEALTVWAELVGQHPEGRFAAASLSRRGDVLQSLGRLDDAHQVWEQLLAQYPDYLFIDDIRDRLRDLP